MDPVVMTLRKRAAAPVDAVWAVLSDTDRFNRAASMDYDLREEVGADGEIRKIGRATKLGVMTMVWEEQPVQFVRPAWFKVERRFSAGPAEVVEVELRLRPDGDGTAIAYEVRATPRSAWVAPLVAIDLRTTTRSQLSATLDAAIREIEGDHGGYDPPPPPLPASAAAALEDRLGAVRSDAVRAALVELVHRAPLYRQGRVMPRVLARQLELDDDEVIRALCDATRSGALALRWELVCPSCLVPKASTPRLWEDGAEVHCTSCNIRFDGTFPDAIQVVWRPADDIRAVDVKTECLVSPGRTPHVLGAARCAGRGGATLEVELDPGGHRLIVGSGALGGAHLEIVDEGPRAVEFTLSRRGLSPVRAVLGRGRVRLSLRSEIDPPVRFAVERWWRPPLVLTAAALLASSDAVDLLPAWAFGPDLTTDTAWGVVVALRAAGFASERDRDALVTLAHRHFADPVLTGRTEVVAVLRDADAALALAREAAATSAVGVAVDAGALVRVARGGRVSVGGHPVERALEIVSDAGTSRVVVDRKALASAPMAAALAAWGADGRVTVDDRFEMRAVLLDFA